MVIPGARPRAGAKKCQIVPKSAKKCHARLGAPSSSPVSPHQHHPFREFRPQIGKETVKFCRAASSSFSFSSSIQPLIHRATRDPSLVTPSGTWHRVASLRRRCKTGCEKAPTHLPPYPDCSFTLDFIGVSRATSPKAAHKSTPAIQNCGGKSAPLPSGYSPHKWAPSQHSGSGHFHRPIRREGGVRANGAPNADRARLPPPSSSVPDLWASS